MTMTPEDTHGKQDSPQGPPSQCLPQQGPSDSDNSTCSKPVSQIQSRHYGWHYSPIEMPPCIYYYPIISC
ncbi:Hypothetical protein SMAX5B_022635 [Scophthalmus maximus]|uniref:Uncharacterized protein n=1 Tax=Scophthalmus maximus TaxID=52904 RepID=A0A2U9C3W0_SCOMX|nr:Hypothetical protein SMAX5B_022635 [Scophthalmus maximus]